MKMFMSSIARRIAGLALAAGIFALFSGSVSARQPSNWQRIDAVKALVTDKLADGQIVKIDLPLVSEDGSSVPMALLADKPLPDGVFIRHLDIFAPGNPAPEVASFDFGPEMSPLSLALRVRLSESQTVIVVARTSDGRAYVSERTIRITTSGCIAGAPGTDASAEMKERVRLPKSFVEGQPAEILTLITHPMVTGLVADAQGNTPKERIINRFSVTLDGAPLLAARFYRSMAANPYVRFSLNPKSGGVMIMTWVEDTGRKTEHKATIDLKPR